MWLYKILPMVSVFAIALNCKICISATLNVKIKGIKNHSEEILVYLCNNDDCHRHIQDIQQSGDFGRLAAKMTVKVNTDNEVTATFKNLPPGNYTAFALHDLIEPQENKPEFNGAFPREPFAMSGMKKPTLPPSFDKVKTQIPSNDSKATLDLDLLDPEDIHVMDVIGDLLSQDNSLSDHLKILNKINGRTCFL